MWAFETTNALIARGPPGLRPRIEGALGGLVRGPLLGSHGGGRLAVVEGVGVHEGEAVERPVLGGPLRAARDPVERASAGPQLIAGLGTGAHAVPGEEPRIAPVTVVLPVPLGEGVGRGRAVETVE